MATVKELGRLRFWLEELRDVRKARDVHYKLVNELRLRAVIMIVNTLWNRYKADTKGDEHPKSFASWLKSKWKLENTYNKRFSTKVRRRWATWQIGTATDILLTADPQEYDERGTQGWFIDTFNELVNRKQPDNPWLIIADCEEILETKPRKKNLTEAQKRKLTIPGGTSLVFTSELKATREAA